MPGPPRAVWQQSVMGEERSQGTSPMGREGSVNKERKKTRTQAAGKAWAAEENPTSLL